MTRAEAMRRPRARAEIERAISRGNQLRSMNMIDPHAQASMERESELEPETIPSLA